jgi:hypothetical protein
MMRLELTYEDTEKIAKAHRCVNSIIESIEKYNRERDLPGKPSSMLLEARRLLSEVLYGE